MLRLPGGRLAYERAIRRSSLPAPARHLALTIATWADIETGVIPDRFQPAQSTLEEATGLSRGAVFKHSKLLEAEGWLVREAGGGRSNRTRHILRIPPGAVTSRVNQSPGDTFTDSGNQSPRDTFPGNQSPGDRETSHLVNENMSPRDTKSSSQSQEVPLSSARTPKRAAAPAGAEEEREIKQPTDNPSAEAVVAAYVQAIHRPVSTATRSKLHQQAAQLLADGFPAAWLADRARELAERGWTDLEQHCDRSTVPTTRVATDSRTGWCGQCLDPNHRMFKDPARDNELVECETCHPAAIARRRRAQETGEAA